MARGRYKKYTAYEKGHFVTEGYAEDVAKKLGVKTKTIYNLASTKEKSPKKEIHRVND